MQLLRRRTGLDAAFCMPIKEKLCCCCHPRKLESLQTLLAERERDSRGVKLLHIVGRTNSAYRPFQKRSIVLDTIYECSTHAGFLHHVVTHDGPTFSWLLHQVVLCFLFSLGTISCLNQPHATTSITRADFEKQRAHHTFHTGHIK